jgi:hypothetical protein
MEEGRRKKEEGKRKTKYEVRSKKKEKGRTKNEERRTNRKNAVVTCGKRPTTQLALHGRDKNRPWFLGTEKPILHIRCGPSSNVCALREQISKKSCNTINRHEKPTSVFHTGAARIRQTRTNYNKTGRETQHETPTTVFRGHASVNFKHNSVTRRGRRRQHTLHNVTTTRARTNSDIIAS